MLSVQHAIYFAARAEAAHDAGASVASLHCVAVRDRILARLQPSELELYYSWATEAILLVDLQQARAPHCSRFAS